MHGNRNEINEFQSLQDLTHDFWGHLIFNERSRHFLASIFEVPCFFIIILFTRNVLTYILTISNIYLNINYFAVHYFVVHYTRKKDLSLIIMSDFEVKYFHLQNTVQKCRIAISSCLMRLNIIYQIKYCHVNIQISWRLPSVRALRN